MNKDHKIYVAGHNGLVGSAIVRRLQASGYNSLLVRGHKDLDLTSQQAVNDFFSQEKPDYIFLSAAKVGGIHANDIYPAEFLQCLPGHRFNVLIHRYVSSNCQGLAADGIDLVNRLMYGSGQSLPLYLRPCRNHNLCALFGKRQADLLADSPASAGNSGDFIF